MHISIDKALLGPIPERILITMVKNAAFVGSTRVNPFHFHHYTTNLVMYVNRVQHLSEPLTMDSSSPFGATRTYETLFSSIRINYDDRAHIITMQIFTQVFYMLGFDLTPDRRTDEEHISLLLQL